MQIGFAGKRVLASDAARSLIGIGITVFADGGMVFHPAFMHRG
ncbi:MAG: hypothetical protein ACRES9_02790 [Gammaproteobacteria bacterium]